MPSTEPVKQGVKNIAWQVPVSVCFLLVYQAQTFLGMSVCTQFMSMCTYMAMVDYTVLELVY